MMKNLKIYESFDKINEAKQGLIVNVYRPSHDATNNGLTSKMDQIRLVGEGVDGPFGPKEGEDYLVVQTKHVGNKPYIYAVPKSLLDSGDLVMFGGNFVYTSDSRFAAVNKYPIPVHDRVEKSR